MTCYSMSSHSNGINKAEMFVDFMPANIHLKTNHCLFIATFLKLRNILLVTQSQNCGHCNITNTMTRMIATHQMKRITPKLQQSIALV